MAKADLQLSEQQILPRLENFGIIGEELQGTFQEKSADVPAPQGAENALSITEACLDKVAKTLEKYFGLPSVVLEKLGGSAFSACFYEAMEGVKATEAKKLLDGMLEGLLPEEPPADTPQHRMPSLESPGMKNLDIPFRI